ncbi:MAG: hypothetical protein EOP04_22960 [Proteobacteria bacterium]|nr:MAG: hypothetical protein EOP04_22960 [Pseudomonadota bacterium]
MSWTHGFTCSEPAVSGTGDFKNIHIDARFAVIFAYGKTTRLGIASTAKEREPDPSMGVALSSLRDATQGKDPQGGATPLCGSSSSTEIILRERGNLSSFTHQICYLSI